MASAATLTAAAAGAGSTAGAAAAAAGPLTMASHCFTISEARSLTPATNTRKALRIQQ